MKSDYKDDPKVYYLGNGYYAEVVALEGDIPDDILANALEEVKKRIMSEELMQANPEDAPVN